jgi:N-methylhydantoinase A
VRAGGAAPRHLHATVRNEGVKARMAKATIDVGGTFTDVLIHDDEAIREFKVFTTPEDPTLGLIRGLQKAANGYGRPLAAFMKGLDVLIHGTTLVTNALLTGQLARVGMLTTEGFRDITEIRRGYKNVHTSMYNIFVPPYRPIVPRERRLGVAERTLYTGDVEEPLDLEKTRAAIAQLRAADVEAVAICLLHSYANPANERAAAALCREMLPGAYVATSHEVLPVWREFERFSTTVVSAAVGPTIDRYLSTLAGRLLDAGFTGSLLLVQSDGLVQSADETRKNAVVLAASGPAAAPVAAIHWGGAMDLADVISVDMGGTSFDVSMIHGGEIPTTTESWIGEERVAIKIVDIQTVGAGGGSIGWIDPLGLLQVGPKSAGAMPGPACYGRGGAEPTVTDADLQLGYLDPDYFLGGEIRLQPALATAALGRLGMRLGFDETQTANAMFTTVNSVMADKITEISTKRGYDPRDFALVAGGGAGGIHAAAIAEYLGIRTVIVPPFAALFSAFGMQAMEVGRSYARSNVIRKDRMDAAQVRTLFAEMEREARDAFAHEQVAPADVVTTWSVDMRYVGQFHEVEVPIHAGTFAESELRSIVDDFHRRHQELYTFATPARPVEFLTFRLKATVRREPLALRSDPRGPAGADPAAALKGTRPCLFGEAVQETRVYAGDRLRSGHHLDGPAIIEQTTTTIIVPPAFTCDVDALGSFVLRIRTP